MSFKTCPKCGFDKNESINKYCGKCGYCFEEEAQKNNINSDKEGNLESAYNNAKTAYLNSDYFKALLLFNNIIEYKDSRTYANKIYNILEYNYKTGLNYFKKGNPKKTILTFQRIRGYKDTERLIHEAHLYEIKEKRRLVPAILSIILALIISVTLSITLFFTLGRDHREYDFSVIEGYAMIDKYNGNEEHIVIPETIMKNNVKYMVVAIGPEAFKGNINIKSVEFPSQIVYIGESAFRECIGLKDITFNEGLEIIDSYAFSHCGVRSYHLPESLKQVGIHSFSSNFYLEEIIAPAAAFNPFRYNSVIYYPFEGSGDNIENKTIDITITSGRLEDYSIKMFTNINNLVFSSEIDNLSASLLYKSSVNTLIINHPTPYIKHNTFYSVRVNKAIIPANVLASFSSNSLINDLTITNGNIPDDTFYNCYRLEKLTLSENVQSIGANNFTNCSELKEIYIPKTITSIGVGSFAGCTSLEKIVVDIDNPIYDSRDNSNAIIETATNTLIIGCKNSIIPNTIVKIKSNAFYQCNNLEVVNIPDSVIEIEDSAFRRCVNLKTLTFGNNLEKIGSYAFYECRLLDSIKIPDSIKEIGKYAFEYCQALSNIELPNTIKSIPDYCFDGCSSLETITLPQGLEKIGTRAFSCCPLKTIIIPDTVTVINSSAFYETDLEEVRLPSKLKVIEESILSHCYNLKRVYIPKSVTAVKKYAFAFTNSFDVYYYGTEQDFNNIIFYDNNLKTKNIHYNYSD